MKISYEKLQNTNCKCNKNWTYGYTDGFKEIIYCFKCKLKIKLRVKILKIVKRWIDE